MSTEVMNDKEKSNDKLERYLCFTLGNEEYAMPLLKVREVIAVPDVTPIPFTPPYFKGLMNLRGQVITIMDLRQKLSIKPSDSGETAVIICDLNPYCFGVVVDSINSVLSPDQSDIADRPEAHGTKANIEYITNVYRKDKRLVLFIDIAKTLNIDDQNLLKGKPSKAA